MAVSAARIAGRGGYPGRGEMLRRMDVLRHRIGDNHGGWAAIRLLGVVAWILVVAVRGDVVVNVMGRAGAGRRRRGQVHCGRGHVALTVLFWITCQNAQL